MGKRRIPASEASARLVIYKNRAIGIRWRKGRLKGEVTTGTNDRDEAVGEKALLLDRLRRGIIPGRESEGPAITWLAFVDRYKNEQVCDMSEGSRSAWTTTSNWVTKLLAPQLLVDVVNKMEITRFRNKLRELKDIKDAEGKYIQRKKSRQTIATYLRTLGAALWWAHEEIEGIPRPPRIRARKGLKQRSSMRSRPITGEEYDKIIAAVKKVRGTPRKNDVREWEDFIHGLAMSSLRIDELRRLSWDPSAELSIETSGKYPMIRMYAEGHKAREDCFQPITPDFWALITRPGRLQTGYVFPLKGVRGKQMTRKAAIRVVSEIGAAAGVITDTTTRKTATSHDIGRRAMLTRLAGSSMSMSQVQQFARHADPKTTSDFYIRHEAEKLAEAVGWTKALQTRCNDSSTPYPSAT